MASFDREDSVYIAKLAEKAERYEDMVEEIKRVAEMVGELTEEEMNLLTTGYKYVIVPLRASWRTVAIIEEVEESRGNKAKVEQIIVYRHNLETKITDICHHYLSVLDKHLELSQDHTNICFYLKKKADYYRYLAEIKTGAEREDAADKSLSAYKTARANAMAELPRADPIRLGLDLNLAVFYDVILGQPERSLEIATNAVNEAFPDNRLNEEQYEDSTKILRVLEENIKLWNGGSSEDTAVGEDSTNIPE